MKQRLVLAVTAVFLGLAAWMTLRPAPVDHSRSRPAATPVVTQTGEVLPAHSAAPTAPVGVSADAPDREQARAAAREVRRTIGDYHTLMGENPVGTNAEIMRALMGHNRRQATLGPPEGQALNAAGELIDQWGTPYFFHQLSRDQMEVHSAGPDRIMGTDDDVVVR